MRARFSLPVVVMFVTLVVVIGAAVMGFFTAATVDSGHWLPMNPTAALGTFLRPIVTILVLSAMAGALGWLVLFALRRDGFHRLEWVALLPYNYGGRDPFER